MGAHAHQPKHAARCGGDEQNGGDEDSDNVDDFEKCNHFMENKRGTR